MTQTQTTKSVVIRISQKARYCRYKIVDVDIIVSGVDIIVLGVDIGVLVSDVLERGHNRLGLRYKVGRIDTAAEGGVKRGIVNYVGRLEAG